MGTNPSPERFESLESGTDLFVFTIKNSLFLYDSPRAPPEKVPGCVPMPMQKSRVY